jgi:hypothetical protein
MSKLNCVGVFSAPLPFYLWLETDPVSETSYFYSKQHRVTEKVKKEKKN